ncbi:MAG: cobalt ECF transporter T component CbiQ [candidate division WOR-3 bacterium]|nr:MAG: cobalt ECF transporter T component CbiQ [candidate division WOR-3 bacterium]
MIEERFSKGDSFVHGIDPRVRVLSALFYSIVIAVTGRMEVAFAGLTAAIIFIVLARLSARHVLHRLLIVNAFILMLWLILPFSFTGKSLLQIGPLSMTEQGIHYALMLTVKCNAIILVNLSLLSTCGVFNLVHALDHLRVPNKLIHLLFFIYRYAHVMQHEYCRLRDTLRIRGFKPETSMHTYRTYGAIIGTLMIRGYERSLQIHKAMICRGFRGHYWLLDHFCIKKSDVLAVSIMMLGIVLLLMLQWKIV